MEDYSFLSVYEIPNKIRVGSTHDGGYIIVDNLCDYDVLLSCGIANDDTFEHYFVNKYNTKCFAFDGTIKDIPHKNKNIDFIRKNIGTTKDTTDMKDLIGKYDNIFLKMDIEGSEFNWINNLAEDDINKLKQICIEFHLEHEYSIDIDTFTKMSAIKKLAETHYCVHLHGNNWRGTTLIGEQVVNIGSSNTNTKTIKLEKNYPSNTKIVFDYKSQYPVQFSYSIDGDTLLIKRTDVDSGWDHNYRCVINGIQIPRVFECTYIHKSLVGDLQLSNRSIPDTRFDTPNTGKWIPPVQDFEYNRIKGNYIPDIVLSGYPFVSDTLIPKIIHQTYKNNNLPELYKMCQTQIKRVNPDFDYRFYTDDDMDLLIKTEFPEYYEKFNELPRMIMKIDMFRYFLMYKYGGLYADMDYLMFKRFDLLNDSVVIPTNRELTEDNQLSSLGNCIFASVPNHPFWKSLIDTLFTTDRENLPSSGTDNVIKSTGPMFVFNMYNEYLNKDEIKVPKRMLFHPPTKRNNEYIQNLANQGCYGMHICTGIWLNNKL